MSSTPTPTLPPGYMIIKCPRPGFMHIEMPEDEATDYAKATIHDYFRQRKPNGTSTATIAPRPVRSWRENIVYRCRLVHERFKANPYGIGASWFYFVIATAFVYSMGNIGVGIVEAFTAGGGWKANVAVVRGFLAALPVVWMMIGFCFPALIANLDAQFKALRIHLRNV